jgi:hypothetical protein
MSTTTETFDLTQTITAIPTTIQVGPEVIRPQVLQAQTQGVHPIPGRPLATRIRIGKDDPLLRFMKAYSLDTSYLEVVDEPESPVAR